MTFSRKLINVAFTLATGQFQGGGNTANLEGLRISARIDGPGGPSLQTASVAIWGMPLTMMNQLSLIGNQFMSTSPQNTLTITAGDNAQNMPTAFTGTIMSAFVDASSQPQICFRVEASPGGALSAQPGTNVGYDGPMDVVQRLQSIAGQANLEFVNNGVSGTLSNQYLYGSPRDQILSIVRSIGAEMSLENGKLSIWKAGQGPDNNITIAAPDMVGYPAFSQAFIYAKTLFNPSLHLGQIVTVQSQIQAATGKWQINRVTHEIESNIPKGKWFTTICGTPQSASVTPSS